MDLSENSIFKLLTNYFSIYGTTNVQKDSYEDFIYKRIQEIIDEEKNIEIMIIIYHRPSRNEGIIKTFRVFCLFDPYFLRGQC